MIIYNIEKTFNPVIIQFFYEFLKLAAFAVILATGGIAGIWRKETDRIVAPIVNQLLSVYGAVVTHLVELENRHKLDRVDSEFLQVWNFLAKTIERPAILYTRRSMHSESTHVKFIYDKVVHGNERILVSAPVKVVAHDTCLVKCIRSRLLSPLALSGHGFCIRIEQDSVPVKYQSLFRCIRTVNVIAIFEVLDVETKYDHGIDITYAVGFREFQSSVRSVLFSVEQKELHARRSV